LTIISASANNEYYLKEAFKFQWDQFLMYDGFTEKEFNRWVEINNFLLQNEISDQNERKEFLEQVSSLTGRMPFELKQLLEMKKSSKGTLEELLQQFQEDRFTTMKNQHAVWSLNYKEAYSHMDSRNAVLDMMLKRKNDSASVNLNLQLMYLDKERIPRAITPIAAQVLINYYQMDIDEPMNTAVKGNLFGSKIPS
jgi:hypothetical protein